MLYTTTNIYKKKKKKGRQDQDDVATEASFFLWFVILSSLFFFLYARHIPGWFYTRLMRVFVLGLLRIDGFRKKKSSAPVTSSFGFVARILQAARDYKCENWGSYAV